METAGSSNPKTQLLQRQLYQRSILHQASAAQRNNRAFVLMCTLYTNICYKQFQSTLQTGPTPERSNKLPSMFVADIQNFVFDPKLSSTCKIHNGSTRSWHGTWQTATVTMQSKVCSLTAQKAGTEVRIQHDASLRAV
jgi:hypothetical protein